MRRAVSAALAAILIVLCPGGDAYRVFAETIAAPAPVAAGTPGAFLGPVDRSWGQTFQNFSRWTSLRPGNVRFPKPLLLALQRLDLNGSGLAVIAPWVSHLAPGSQARLDAIGTLDEHEQASIQAEALRAYLAAAPEAQELASRDESFAIYGAEIRSAVGTAAPRQRISRKLKESGRALLRHMQSVRLESEAVTLAPSVKDYANWTVNDWKPRLWTLREPLVVAEYAASHTRVGLDPDNAREQLPTTVVEELEALQNRNDRNSKVSLTEALQPHLVLKQSDDPAAVARGLAGERDPRPIERYLRGRLSRAGAGGVRIPLEKVLHPFIRKNVNTYASCTGPNCLNAAVSVNRKNRYRAEYLSPSDFPAVVRDSGYRELAAGESPQVGDLIAYYDPSDPTVVHAATFVTQDILFSKNGFGKRAPYAFQSRKAVEDTYFGQDGFKSVVYRPSGTMTGSGARLAPRISGRSRYGFLLQPRFWRETAQVLLWAAHDSLASLLHRARRAPKAAVVTAAALALSLIPLVGAVAFHEFGHYLAARASGVRVHEVVLFSADRKSLHGHVIHDGGLNRGKQDFITAAGPLFGVLHAAACTAGLIVTAWVMRLAAPPDPSATGLAVVLYLIFHTAASLTSTWLTLRDDTPDSDMGRLRRHRPTAA